MDTLRTLYFLHEFNLAVDQGIILESFVSGPHQLIRIVCDTPLGVRGGFCFTHLRDFWVVELNGEKLVEVGCGVCGFHSHPKNPASYRKIGKSAYVNGGESE